MPDPADTIRKVLVGKPYALAELTELEQQLADLRRDWAMYSHEAKDATDRAVAAEADRDRLQADNDVLRELPSRAVVLERDRYREALEHLVLLKDGPRDDAYRAAKEAAWGIARAALDRHTNHTTTGGTP